MHAVWHEQVEAVLSCTDTPFADITDWLSIDQAFTPAHREDIAVDTPSSYLMKAT